MCASSAPMRGSGAEKLTVQFDAQGRVRRLDCEGAVKFRRGDVEEASASTARYTA